MAWFAFWVSFGLVAASPTAPIRKVDRMRVVGGPVLDAETRPGVYVWVEDGFFRVAVVGRRERRSTLRVRLETTAAFGAADLGDFRATTVGARRIVLEARVQRVPAQARFKTDGELVVSEARINRRTAPIFVGPLSARAAARVRIGRY